jgi:predicted regulator of amino acid metabolism with ACT domain
MIETSKTDLAGIDQAKLAEAEALCAQIEAESYSKFDVDFDAQVKKKNWQSTDEEILNDDQLANLFSEMKKENHAQKIAQMEKIKIEK